MELSELKNQIRDLIKEAGYGDKIYISFYDKNTKYTNRINKTKNQLWECNVCEKTIGIEGKKFHLNSKKHIDKVNGIIRKPKGLEYISCECGKTYMRRGHKVHLNSNIHKKFIEFGIKYSSQREHNKKRSRIINKDLCPCGSYIESSFMNNHKKSVKHQNWLVDDIILSNVDAIDCPCGGQYFYKLRETHFKTLKHLSYLGQS